MNQLSELSTAWKGHELFALWLVSFLNPKVTVDLGVDYGYSTFVLAKKNTGIVYGIDSFEGDAIIGTRCTLHLVESFISRNKITNVKLIKGYFNQVSKTWTEPIDILHIDGLHTYQAVKEDFECYQNFLHDQSVVIFHDTVSYPHDVGKFFLELKLHKVNFLHSNGLGVASKNLETIKLISNVFDLPIIETKSS